jgi:hypothetical protein
VIASPCPACLPPGTLCTAVCTAEYPSKPPKVRFPPNFCHPNVFPQGDGEFALVGGVAARPGRLSMRMLTAQHHLLASLTICHPLRVPPTDLPHRPWPKRQLLPLLPAAVCHRVPVNHDPCCCCLPACLPRTHRLARRLVLPQCACRSSIPRRAGGRQSQSSRSWWGCRWALGGVGLGRCFTACLAGCPLLSVPDCVLLPLPNLPIAQCLLLLLLLLLLLMLLPHLLAYRVLANQATTLP